jgi:hypothetical protein
VVQLRVLAVERKDVEGNMEVKKIEKPILFNTAMVRATLEDRKSQTRRLITKLRWFGDVTEFQPSNGSGLDWKFRDGTNHWNYITNDMALDMLPYQVGDILWVRESFFVEPGRKIKPGATHPWGEFEDEVFFRADDESLPGAKWQPSIHMPRSVARLFLEVTDVRIERLQDISEEDAKSEGPTQHPDYPDEFFTTWEGAFRYLWDSINAKRAPWDSNPTVAVYSFKLVE